MNLPQFHKPSHTPADPSHLRADTVNVAHAVILILSVLLIVFISYDTFNNIPFLSNSSYMTFQLAVCIIFMADFFLELFLTPHGLRKRYIRSRWLFLLLSIPYLSIIRSYHLQLSPDALYFIRFIPLARGGLALVIVLNYISANRITGIFVSYVSILVLTTYFAALIFYEREHPVNPHIGNYWNAFIWCALQTTTLGSPVPPFTVAGKIISVILSYMGIIMYPLFTVYISSIIIDRTSVLNFIKRQGANVKTTDSSPHLATADTPTVADSGKKM